MGCRDLSKRDNGPHIGTHFQVVGERGCCTCGWTAGGTVRMIETSPSPRSLCSNANCGWRTTWDAWCKADTGMNPRCHVILQNRSKKRHAFFLNKGVLERHLL